MGTSIAKKIREMAASRRDGYALPGACYGDQTIYEAELDGIWLRQWVFAGHDCQIKNPGDFFLLEIGSEPVIVIRGEDGQVRAMINVCRHRGTLICTEPTGSVKRLVCPYHQWVYQTDGSLQSCRGMQEDLDRSQLGLKPVATRNVEGMIYVCLAEQPPDFEAAYDAMHTLAKPQGMCRAKVAQIVDYEVKANWKIVWENNRECYHCNHNHPQYIQANYDHFNADDITPGIREKIDAAVDASVRTWEEQGIAVTHKASGMASFPDPDHDLWYAANRTVLSEGYVSETMDGQQKAPLMGSYQSADVGTLRMRTMPNMWMHASCDHVCSTRLIPLGIEQTQVRVTWLVHEDAVEGEDYHLKDIIPFWQLTSEQDWELCERVQRGVTARGYIPGPFSTHKEYNVEAFVRWFLKELQTSASAE